MIPFPGLPGVRAENGLATQWNLGQDTLVSGIVRGTPFDQVFPGDMILPNVPTQGMSYLYPVLGLEHLELKDTARGLRAETHESSRSVTYATGTVQRDSWKVPVDVAEIAAAGGVPGRPSFNLRRDNAFLARQIVKTAIEWKKRNLLVTPGNYAVSYDLSALGAQWGPTGTGDPFVQLWTAITAMGSVQPSDLSLYVSRKALLGFFQSPVWRSTRAGTSAALSNDPSIELMRSFLGIKSIWTSNPTVANTAGGQDSMYDNVAILYLDTNLGLNSRFGNYVPGKTFVWNDGVSAQSWYDENRTSWYESWNEWSGPVIIDNTKMILFTNVST